MPFQGSEIVWESLLINQETLEKEINALGENIWEERKRRNRATPNLLKIWESYTKDFNSDNSSQIQTGRESLTLGTRTPNYNYSYRELKNENLE